MNSLYAGLRTVEKGFNLAAPVPVLGYFTSKLRVLAGRIEALTGIMMMGYAAMGLGINRIRRHPLEASENHFQAKFYAGAELTAHGVLNMVRGKAEWIGACGLGIPNGMGFIGTSIYKRELAAPIFEYGQFFPERPSSYVAPDYPRDQIVRSSWANRGRS